MYSINVIGRHKNERWIQLEFKIDKFSEPLVIYGANIEEAMKKLYQQLDLHLGSKTYVLELKWEENSFVNSHACLDHPVK